MKSWSCNRWIFLRVLQVDQISDAVYADFIILMTGGEVVPPDDEYRQILDAMVQGDDFTVSAFALIW